MDQVPDGCAHSPELPELRERLDNTLRFGGLIWSQELELIDLFNLSIFYDSMIARGNYRVHSQLLKSFTACKFHPDRYL